MRKALLSENGFNIENVAMPRYRNNEILIKTVACGVCEGDVFRYSEVKEKGKAGGGVDNRTGISIGHENTGIIEAIGSDVESFAIGDVVTALNGDYAEYWVTVPQMLSKLPSSVSPVVALGEPIACCVHAADRFRIRLGDRVAILGTGFMGLVSLQLAKIQGASFILATDLFEWRLEQAKYFGADVVEKADIKTDVLLKKYGDFDVVIEAAGVPQTIEVASQLVKQHGTIVLVGYHQSESGKRNIDMKLWNFKAIDVVNGHVRRNDEKLDAMKRGIELIEHEKIDISNLIESYDFTDINKAFHDLTSRKQGLFKAVLTFES